MTARIMTFLTRMQAAHPTRVWWLCAASLAAVLLIPLLLVQIPPLLDYSNHLARMYILAHPEDAIIRRFYGPAWGIVPYTLTDLLAVGLQREVSLFVTGKIMLGIALVLPTIGVIVYNYVTYRKLSLWALSFGVFSYNALFLLCLYNFYISCGVALLMASAWITLRDRHVYLDILLSALLSAGLFLIHLYGAVFYLILVGSFELARIERGHPERPLWRQLLGVAIKLFPATTVICAMDILSHSFTTNSQTLYLEPTYKLAELEYPWTGYVSAGLLIAFTIWLGLYFGVKDRLLTIRAPAAIAAGVCFVLYLVLPFELSGAALFSSRFIVMSAMVLWAGMLPGPMTPRMRSWVTGLLLMLLVFNTGTTSFAWLREERDIEALRSVIAPVEPGSRVLYITGTDQQMDDYAPHAPFGENLTLFPAYLHFPALLVFEHESFWPLMLAVKGTMPIKVNPPYDKLAMSQGGPAPYNCLDITHCDPDVLRGMPFLRRWRHYFNYVLLLPARAVPDAAHIDPDALQLVGINDFAALYRVKPLAAEP